MESAKDKFLKTWVSGNLAVYPIALGIVHPLIAHGFTGDHDKLLTTPQFIMHTLSVALFIVALSYVQNKALQQSGKGKNLAGIWPLLFFVPWVFWLGYYTLYVPFDILFMFLSIGVINAVQIRHMVKFPGKWIWQCILTYFLAAVAGIVIGLGAYLLYFKDLQGIARDLVTWLLISIPAAIVIALLSRAFLKAQIIIPEQLSLSPLKEERA